MPEKIISYNVNGIRAAQKKGFNEWLKTEAPDIIGLQEIKIQDGQIDPSVYEEMGYHHYWHYAVKKGYSGLALLSRNKPDNVMYGFNYEKYDAEARLIRADYGDITLLNVYIPSGTTGDVRQAFKMDFLQDFLMYVQKLQQERKNLIIMGDFNICHKPIDINHPEKHQKSSGFLPEERAWMDDFIYTGFIDAFRQFNKDPENYSWWSYRANARAKNLGWRLDYHMITSSLLPALVYAEILSDVYHSDHCPVKIGMKQMQ